MDAVVGTQVRVRIESLIKNAKRNLILVSPYIEPWKRLEMLIQSAQARKVKVIIIARGGPDLDKQKRNTASLREFGINVGFLDRLHAKVYVSESTAILTSMNLLRSSQEGSWEAALQFDLAKDRDGYGKVAGIAVQTLKELGEQKQREDHLRTLKEPAKAAGQPRKNQRAAKPKATKKKPDLRAGVCIRCGDELVLDTNRPLCSACFRAWAKFQNEDYEESFCHVCGNDHGTSMRKPVCPRCYRKSAV